jgi:cystathionine beta-lyase/cystathionine gamma-synthase
MKFCTAILPPVVSAPEQEAAGVTADVIRLSTGPGDIAEILWDLAPATVYLWDFTAAACFIAFFW